MSANTTVSEGLTEASASRMTHRIGSFPCHVDISTGPLECPHNMATASARVSGRRHSRRGATKAFL